MSPRSDLAPRSRRPARPARTLLAVGLLVAVGLLAAACGDDDGATAEAPDPAPTTPVAPAGTAGPTTTAGPTPRWATTTVAEVPVPDASTVADLLALDRPLVIAHAGGDLEAPHSTMYAFRTAVEAGADVLELDVQLTGDGVLVVQHDDTVDKTTEASGPVADLDLAELQALDNAYWFSPECWPCQDRPVDEYVHRGVRTGDRPPPDGATSDDFRVPTFRELAETFPDHVLDVEIKGSFPDAVAAAEVLAAEIADLGRTDSVIVVSFDDEVLAAFRELAPEVTTSPGVGAMTEWILGGVPLDGHQIVQVPPFFDGIEIVTADFVSMAHDAGIDVWVWPDDAGAQENADFYAELVGLGVDGIIAGRPTVMAEVAGSSS